MRKRAIAGLTVMGAAIATVMATSPAFADGHCDANRVCMWEDDAFKGDRWVNTTVGGPPWDYNIDGWNGDNEISSIDNATGRYILVWSNDQADGRSLCVPPHTDMASLGNFDNDAEYFQVVDRC